MTDHRESPGMSDSAVVPHGLPMGAGRGLFESSTFTCADCHKVVINNPDRTRPRGYCPKCDHYLCDYCESIRFASGGECKNLKMRIDRYLNELAKNPAAPPFQLFS